jgi:hypothetical protein
VDLSFYTNHCSDMQHWLTLLSIIVFNVWVACILTSDPLISLYADTVLTTCSNNP